MGAKHASEMGINTLKKTPICFHLKNKFIRLLLSNQKDHLAIK